MFNLAYDENIQFPNIFQVLIGLNIKLTIAPITTTNASYAWWLIFLNLKFNTRNFQCNLRQTDKLADFKSQMDFFFWLRNCDMIFRPIKNWIMFLFGAQK